MFGLLTNVMLAVTTALAAMSASFVGGVAVTPELERPPGLDAGLDLDATTEKAGATADADVGDGEANAGADASSENARASGSAGVGGLGVPELPTV